MNPTSKRLATAFLGYILLVILLLTWNPFQFAAPEHIAFSLHSGQRDAIANILLFLPVGFLYRLGQGSRRGAILLTAAISAGIEAGQLFLPGRTPSVVDWALNTFGAGLGAILHDLLAKRITSAPRLVGQLSLETPLMGLLYLLAPLLWVNRLVPDESSSRWVLTSLVGLCGGIILSEVYDQWWGRVSPLSSWRVALATGTWFFVGVGQSLLSQPLVGWISLVSIAIFSAALAVISRPSANRRFEHEALRRVIVIFVLYLLLQALWSPFRLSGSWHSMLGLTDPLTPADIHVNIRFLEHLAAFTVLGYIAAEWQGRAELSVRQDFPRLLLIGTLSATLLEVLAGFQAGAGASLLRLMLAVCGSLFGGIPYHLQRDYVRFLLGRSTLTPPPPAT